jgi:hypothetical protein
MIGSDVADKRDGIVRPAFVHTRCNASRYELTESLNLGVETDSASLLKSDWSNEPFLLSEYVGV